MSPSGPPPAVARALAEYKRECMKDSRLHRLDLRRLTGIEPGPHQTELELLDFAVAPSLQAETREQVNRTAAILHELRNPALSVDRRRELQEQLFLLEASRWDHHRSPYSPRTVSFAEALHLHPQLTLIGDPGAGKTVLTRLIFLACIDEGVGTRALRLLCDDDRYNPAALEAVRALRELLPVRLPLGKLEGAFSTSQELSIEEFIRQHLRAQKVSDLLLEELDALVEGGKLFLLCDGLDEIPERQRERFVEALTTFFGRHETVRLLVTSRPNGYHPRVPNLAHAHLAPLHLHQQQELITRLHRLVEQREGDDAEGVARARHRTHALLKEIQPRRSWYWLKGNPLLLTLAALAPTNLDGGPQHEVIIYENFIRTLLGKWRAVLDRSKAQADELMDVWSNVALELVRQEKRSGGVQALFCRILSKVIREASTSPPIDEKTALHLALETGLLQEHGEALVFWHSTFAEFLAARALVRRGEEGVAERILAQESLPPLVLRFAATQLDHVCHAEEEVTRLVNGMLSRDEHGANRLLRPGLRAVSDWIQNGLRLEKTLAEQVWSTWAGILEKTPPSPLWEPFQKLARRGPASPLPARLIERFACLQDHGVLEVRYGISYLIAPAAAGVPAAREVCAQWLTSRDPELSSYGALGLASWGEWTFQVIKLLAQFGGLYGLDPEQVGDRVRQAGAPLQETLRKLLLMEAASEADKADEKKLSAWRSLQLSAACLLAAAKQWDEEVAGVLKQALGKSDVRSQEAATTLLKFCADLEPVQAALVDWIGEESNLGEHARKVVQEVAPCLGGMPEKVLKRTAEATPKVQRELEQLLAKLGEEWRSLLDTLRRWLEDPQPERRLCAARLLHRFVPDDVHLHAALRQDMRSPNELTRARWAWLAVEFGPRFYHDAMIALQSCAPTRDPDVRGLVFEQMPSLLSKLDWKPLDGWIRCARSHKVPIESRLAAARLVSSAPTKDKQLAVPALYELLEAEEPAIRRQAAHELLRHGEANARIVAVEAEAAVRASSTGDDSSFRWSLERAKPFATAVVQAILCGLPEKESPSEPEGWRWISTTRWHDRLAALVAAEPSAVEHLLDALHRPGPAGDAPFRAVEKLTREHAFAQEALRQRIGAGLLAGLNTPDKLLFLELGLLCPRTAPAAIEAIQVMTLHELTQAELDVLAKRLHAADGTRDAARLWRRMLDGPDLESVLEAAEALLVRFPDEAGPWVQTALGRVLKTELPSVRLDAARVALRCGVLHEEAFAVLLGCLELAGRPYERRQRGRFGLFHDSQGIGHGTQRNHPLNSLHFLQKERRVDFEAMRALCIYSPNVGIPQLKAWLDDEEEARFDHAILLLVKQDSDREAVQNAFMTRLRSVDRKRLEHLLHLMHMHRIHLPSAAEQVVERLIPRPDFLDEDALCLREWLHEYPNLWAVIRKQEPELRPAFACLFSYSVPITRDAILFAVELALSHAANGAAEESALWLERWCNPSRGENEESATFSASVRRVLCEVILERTPPDDLRTLLQFDGLAQMWKLPIQHRLDVLRHALSIDVVTAAPDTEERMDLFRLQVEAAQRFQKLGGRDERILPILEAAMYAFAADHFPETVQRMGTLLSLRPPDESLQRILLRAMTAANEQFFLHNALEVFDQAGISVEQRTDILISRLNARYEGDWLNKNRRLEAPFILESLEALGHAPERLAALVVDFVSGFGEELAPDTLLELSKRPELSASTAAELVLRALARGHREADIQWVERFTSRRDKPDHFEHWKGSEGENYLPLRQRGLSRLSEVEDFPLVWKVLVEMADVPAADNLYALYARTQSGGFLSEIEWDNLSDRLALKPGDTLSTRLAKEWLALGLWKTLEKQTVDRLLQS